MSDLWPKPLPVIGVTGEFSSGKTLFGLSICPEKTLVYDLEASSKTYVELGFTRIDVPETLSKMYPSGFRPQDLWAWWQAHVRAIKPGQYRVIMVDPVSELETGLTEWVRSNASRFGRTPGQYLKMQGLLWGDVKEYWKTVLGEVASRCESFVFVTHMGNVWAGDRPTQKRKPKGKETLFELASLYLMLERKPDVQGQVPAKPAGIVLKSRLAHTTIRDGEVSIQPILPPRLPVATPKAIREYCLKPANYDSLSEQERVQEERLSEDERAQLRLAAAEAEAEALRLKIELEGKRPASPPADQPPATRERTKEDPPGLATDEQLAQIKQYRDQLFDAEGLSAEDRASSWKAAMAKRGVQSARELTRQQAQELISSLEYRLTLSDMQASLQEPAERNATFRGT